MEDREFNVTKFLQVCQVLQPLIVELFGSRPGMEGREGAYYGACDEYGTPLAIIGVGYAPRDKRPKYFDLAREKLYRLALMWRYTRHHTSRESANPEVGQFPGAVWARPFGFSISGYTADVDELGAAAIAVCMGYLTRGTVGFCLCNNPLGGRIGHLLDMIEDRFAGLPDNPKTT